MNKQLILTRMLASVLLLSSATSVATTLTYTATFIGSGGDAHYGNGDTSTNTFPALSIPMFDPILGTLDKVSYELSGWRSLDLTCEGGGLYCNARIDGLFTLYSENKNTQTLIAQINPEITDLVYYFAPSGQSVSDTLYDEDSVLGEITDSTVLANAFTADTFPADDYYDLSFYANDGGYYGYASPSYFSELVWDADATVKLTYHYTPSTTTIPEPETIALMLVGFGLMGFMAPVRR